MLKNLALKMFTIKFYGYLNCLTKKKKCHKKDK